MPSPFHTITSEETDRLFVAIMKIADPLVREACIRAIEDEARSQWDAR